MVLLARLEELVMDQMYAVGWRMGLDKASQGVGFLEIVRCASYSARRATSDRR